MKAKLFRSGVDKGEPFDIGAEATIGRSAENSIRLEPDAVSSRHARIYFDDERGRYFLEDLDSLNGTKLDGIEVVRAEQLDRLHVIEFGGDGLEFVFQAVDLSPVATSSADDPSAASGAAASGTAVDQEMPELPANLADESEPVGETIPVDGTSADREMPETPQTLLDDLDAEETLPVPVDAEEPPAPEPTPVGGEAPYYLRLHEPPDAEPIPLFPGQRVVGRARSADISVGSPSVSRRHAILSIGDGVTVRDLGSRNQTFVNDVRVEDEAEVALGAELRFGALGATLVAGKDVV